MIALKSSTSDGSLFRVYDDEILIGYINRQRSVTGNRYRASINRHDEDEEKEFDSPDDAIQWIEIHR